VHDTLSRFGTRIFLAGTPSDRVGRGCSADVPWASAHDVWTIGASMERRSRGERYSPVRREAPWGRCFVL